MPRNKSCKFCQIIGNKAPGYVVFEDEFSIAFLDYRPLFPGHTLLVPKDHYATLPDLPQSLTAPLFRNAQIMCTVVKEAMTAQGTFFAINNTVSQSVPHLHIHIVPRTKGDGLKGFFWPRNNYKDESHIKETAERIKNTLRKLKA